MADGGRELYRRADGFVEDRHGNLACVMLTCKRKNERGHLFRFRLSPMSEVLNVEWPIGQTLQIFPPEVTMALLKRGHARAVTDEEIAAYDALHNPAPEKTPATYTAEPKRKASQKPADGDTVPETAEATDPLSEGVGLTEQKDETNG